MTSEPLETFDSRPEAEARLGFWAARLRAMGLTPRFGVRIRQIRLSVWGDAYGIYVERQSGAERT